MRKSISFWIKKVYSFFLSKKNGVFIEDDGTKVYYKNDKIHRENGPAIIQPLVW